MKHNGKEIREFLMCCNYMVLSDEALKEFVCQECGYIYTIRDHSVNLIPPPPFVKRD